MRLIDEAGAAERPTQASETDPEPARFLELHPPGSARHRALLEQLLLAPSPEGEPDESRSALLGGLARAVRMAESEHGSTVRVRWRGAMSAVGAAPRPSIRLIGESAESVRQAVPKLTKEGGRDA